MIEISDDSIAKIGRWPWDRDWHATLITALKEGGADAVAFDVIFSEPSKLENDAVLAQAIRLSGNVYLAQALESSKNTPYFFKSLPEFLNASAGGGHINLQPDIDGVMRRIRLAFPFEGKVVPQLSLAIILKLLGAEAKDVTFNNSKLVINLEKTNSHLTVPLDGEGDFILNWTGKWAESFKHYSYIDVIQSYAAVKRGERPLIPLSTFKGKICYIGTTASGLFDIRPTPLEPAYPAVGVNLTVLNNLLERRFIRTFNFTHNFILFLLISIVLYRIMRIPNYIRSSFYAAAAALIFVLTGILVFLYFRWWINIIYPLAMIFTMYFFITLYNQLSVSIERTKLLKLATRDSLTGLYNIGHFKLLLKAEIMMISLRREKNLSIILGDIDNFKKTNDTYGHVTGDSVLKEVAATVRANCRALDVAARYGGEEFILMLPGANAEQAFKIADTIRKAIEAKVFPNEKEPFQTSISIGCAQISPDERDIEQIVQRADRALYEAKRTGKNKVVVASDSKKEG